MTGHRRGGRHVATLTATLAAALLAVLAGCADFSATPPSYTVQPSLTPAVVTPVVPDPPGGSGGPSTPSSSGSSTAPDPCKPTDPAVIAACLSSPVGIQPLDGQSAIVGERTTGRILKVIARQDPVEVARVPGVDATGDGGLLGIALSPSYAQDQLIYAYVTTGTDNRIYRIAPGEAPKAVFSGIPKGAKNNGGAIMFSGRQLYVGTGDTRRPELAADPASLAGKLLRLDEFGRPAGASLDGDTARFASGFTDPTGMCELPTGSVGVVDHRPAADLLLAAVPGKDYRQPRSGDAAWTWRASDGGTADCAVAGGRLAASSLDGKKATAVAMSAAGAFNGTPTTILDGRYGRLRTIEAGPENLFWLATSNKDGKGKPVPSDDRVIVLPSGGGGDGGVD